MHLLQSLAIYVNKQWQAFHDDKLFIAKVYDQFETALHLYLHSCVARLTRLNSLEQLLRGFQDKYRAANTASKRQEETPELYKKTILEHGSEQVLGANLMNDQTYWLNCDLGKCWGADQLTVQNEQCVSSDECQMSVTVTLDFLQAVFLWDWNSANAALC